ncbi:lipoprotein [Salmonella enterica subsp. enterica serovar Choleraesuis]|nr:lipoprotein [Salmonella enterica subsp. enterica serovar Choleraesuis]
MKKVIWMVMAVSMVAGCSSPASRMADCESQGISRDTCYMAEQNRQNAINAAAEKQALENAREATSQHAQNAKRFPAVTKHYQGMEIKRDKQGIVTVDGKPAAQGETNDDAVVYTQGLYTVIFYKTGKVAVMKDNVFQGFAK